MYEAHFGLADLPFRIAPDPRFFVDTAPHRVAIRALLDGLSRGDEFTPLVGDFGTGKTTAARRMLDEAEPGRHVIAELPRIRDEGDDLLDRVAEALGMRRPKAVPPMGSLLPQFEALARDGCDAWLMVDEAESLGAGALNRLRKLTSVRVDGRPSLHVLLVGRSPPAGIERLQHIGRPLKVGAPVCMQPLDASGTHEYILERLRLAGWSGRPVFDAHATAEIHARCQGNPGRVNRLCGRVLLHLYMQGRHEVDAQVVGMVDEMLRSEMSGHPAGIVLPTAAPAAAHAHADADAGAAPRVPSGAGSDLDLDMELPPAEPVKAIVPAGRPAETRLALREPTVPALPRRGRLRSHGVPRGVAVAALLVSGGLLWQTILRVASAYSEQARFAAAAAAYSRQSVATPAHDVAPLLKAALVPAPSTPQAMPSRDAEALLARAEQALAQAPPAAGAATTPETVPAGLHDATRAAGHEAHARRALAAHAGQTPPAARGVAQGPVATATCSLDGASLGLCTRSPARRATPEPDPAATREQAPASARKAAPAPACEPVRAALALCPEGTRASP